MKRPEPLRENHKTQDPSAQTKRKPPNPLAKPEPLAPLRVLMVEDSENDALLLEIELQRAGYEPLLKRVETRQEMSAALASQSWDLVIADYVLPRFDGLEALQLVKANGLDVPLIIVSGQISDKTAVTAMKAGAHDYVMKDNLARLGPAVRRELREAEGRRARQAADQKLHLEQVFRLAIESSVPAGITAVDLEGRQTYVNPAFCAMVGWGQEDLIGARPPFVYWPSGQVETISGELAKMVQGVGPAGGLELRYRRRSGESISVLVQVTPLKDALGNVTGWVSSNSDITERKQAEARLAAEHTITRLLASAASLDLAAPGILQALLESLEVDVAGLWVPTDTQDALRLTAMVGRDASAELRSFLESSQQLTLKSGVGLPGGVWESGEAILVTELEGEADFRRREPASRAGLRSGMAFPIQSEGRFFGVLEFFTRRPLQSHEIWLGMMTAISSEIGQFTHRRGAEEALRQAHEELEIRVQRRTAELRAANSKLQTAIAERKRLENELLEITEKERRRIGLDLHDDLGQRLSGIVLMTKGLELKLAKMKSNAATDAARIHSLVQEAMSHARDLAHDLATLDMQKKTLPEALGDLAAHARELFGISCEYTQQGTMPSLDPAVVVQLCKIAQEALTNAIKHGKSTHAAIALDIEPGQMTLTIRNNGLPFPNLDGLSKGMGLRIMNYRASLIEGSLEIKANGAQGTLVSCYVPI